MRKISGSLILAYVGGLFLAGNMIYVFGKGLLLSFGIIPFEGELSAHLQPSTIEVLIAGFAFLYFYTEGDPYKLTSLADER